MTYKELQDKAKELGLPYVEVSKKDLRKSIDGKVGTPVETPSTEEVPTPPVSEDGIPPDPVSEEKVPVVEHPVIVSNEQPKAKRGRPAKLAETVFAKAQDEKLSVTDDKEKEIKIPENVNAAVIYDGNFKVRTYSLESHGEEFIDMAKSFVSDNPKLRIEYYIYSQFLKCKNCGSPIVCGTCGKQVS